MDAVRCFPKGSAPKLSADKQDYKVVQVAESEGGKKIVRYVDPASHEPDPSISYGYVTAFTYTHCQDMGLLSECDVEANVKLQPSCGTFSYSEIPKFYQYCLGMTGTLDCECAINFSNITSSAIMCVCDLRRNWMFLFNTCCE